MNKSKSLDVKQKILQLNIPMSLEGSTQLQGCKKTNQPKMKQKNQNTNYSKIPKKGMLSLEVVF